MCELMRFTLYGICCRLSLKIDLNELLHQAEIMFQEYCSKTVDNSFQIVDTPSPVKEPSAPRYTSRFKLLKKKAN